MELITIPNNVKNTKMNVSSLITVPNDFDSGFLAKSFDATKMHLWMNCLVQNKNCANEKYNF